MYALIVTALKFSKIEDARKALEETRVKRGEVVMEAKNSVMNMDLVVSAIKTYGETIPAFVERKERMTGFYARL